MKLTDQLFSTKSAIVLPDQTNPEWPIMLELHEVDLGNESDAAIYVKDEIVMVAFARSDGELISREGPNTFAAGDALITGSTGDRWSVSRLRFEAKYQPVDPTGSGEMGVDGLYRSRPVPVRAKQMHVNFSILRSAGGDRLRGLANDWLLQYALGDYGVVEDARFKQVYRPLMDDTP